MKRVLIFSTAYLPLVGGAEIAVKEITDRVKNFSFDLVAPKIKGGLKKFERIGNIDVYRVGFGLGKIDKLLFPILGFSKASALKKKNNYSAIWSIMASYGGFAALFFKMRNKKIPFLLTLQEGDDEKDILNKIGFFYPLWRKIFEYADYTQVISNYLKDFAKRHGVRSEISVIPNGVDLDLFNREIGEEERMKLRSHLGISKNDFTIVTVSRLVKKNGVEDTIRAISVLKKKEPETSFKLLIIGKGDLEGHLKMITEKLGLKDKIKFVGFVDYKDLPKYLKVSDLFIRPSLSEGLGNAFLEAMAAGVPVIGTNVGGIPDFLINKETGLFCKVKDYGDIADKIMMVIEDQFLKNRLVQNGKSMAFKNYSWNKIASQMFVVFLKLANN